MNEDNIKLRADLLAPSRLNPFCGHVTPSRTAMFMTAQERAIRDEERKQFVKELIEVKE